MAFRNQDSEEPASFFGIGPGIVQGSPGNIADEVAARMTQSGDLDPSNINVEVLGGTVTLGGIVPDQGMIYIAEDIVRTVEGVEHVDNQLMASRTHGPSKGPDTRDKRRIRRKRTHGSGKGPDRPKTGTHGPGKGPDKRRKTGSR